MCDCRNQKNGQHPAQHVEPEPEPEPEPEHNNNSNNNSNNAATAAATATAAALSPRTPSRAGSQLVPPPPTDPQHAMSRANRQDEGAERTRLIAGCGSFAPAPRRPAAPRSADHPALRGGRRAVRCDAFSSQPVILAQQSFAPCTHTHTHTSAAKRVRGGLQPLVSLLSLLTEASRALDEHCVGRSGIAVRRLFERRLP